MAWVTPDFIRKWYSGQQVGADTPHGVVQVQTGKWLRIFDPWPRPRIRAQIQGEPHAGVWTDGSGRHTGGRGGFWQATWEATSDWVELPNMLTIKRSRDFSQKGITVLTLTLDALDFQEKVGDLGDAFHVIVPGFLSANRGVVAHTTRPNPGWETNEFQGLIKDGVKVRVWQGLGAPGVDGDGNSPPIDGGDNGAWTFVGHIDVVDTDAGDTTQGNANRIQITARNGKLLTDEKLFGFSKSPQLKTPVTFADDLASDSKALVGYRAAASGFEPGYPPSLVLDRPKRPWDYQVSQAPGTTDQQVPQQPDPAYGTMWRGPAGSEHDIQWVQIRLPQGRYEDCWLYLPEGAMACYIGIFAKPIVSYRLNTIYDSQTAGNTPDDINQAVAKETSRPSTVDGVDLPENAWVGAGVVPGQDWKSFRHIGSLSSGSPMIVQFGRTFELGERSILRLGFTNLPVIDGHNRAAVSDLHGRKRKLHQDAQRGQYILVPDASEPVKVVLRWAGYKDWDIEKAGVRLNGNLVFDQTKAMIEPINTLATQTGFIFFIADPVDGNSEGVPTFRRDSSTLLDNTYVAADLRDDGMLTGCKVSETDEDRVAFIRVRGSSAPPSDDIPGSSVHLPFGGGFVGLGGDTIKRIMAVYETPWSHSGATAGVLRRVIYHEDNIDSYGQCVMGCFLIAISAALAMHTVQLTTAGHPIIELDDQVTVLDEASGVNSRVWVTKHEDTMALGDLQSSSGSGGAGSWTATIEGALMDSDDFAAVMSDCLRVDWHKLALATGTDPGSGQPPLPGPLKKGKSRKPKIR